MSQSKNALTRRSRGRIIRYSILITVIYLVVFGYLSVRPFDDWALAPFVDGMLGVFMGAGAIASFLLAGAWFRYDLLWVILLMLPFSHVFAVLAIASHIAGVLTARWLFFAEAEHVVGLYYGKR